LEYEYVYYSSIVRAIRNYNWQCTNSVPSKE
jgi:hypothetical protein